MDDRPMSDRDALLVCLALLFLAALFDFGAAVVHYEAQRQTLRVLKEMLLKDAP